MKTGQQKTCINCGSPLTGEYCSHCGQRDGERKLTTKAVLSSAVQELFKINSGFLFTAYRLATRPWIVIRDYINGHRVHYTKPFTMLITVLLYLVLLGAVFDAEFEVSVEFNTDLGSGGNSWFLSPLIQDLTKSIVFWIVGCSIPAAFATYITYYKIIGRKYNFAEYLVAAVYAFCALMVWATLFVFIKAANSTVGEICNFIVDVYILFGLLYHAFPLKNRWKRFGMMLLCIICIVVFVTLYMSVVAALLFLIS